MNATALWVVILVAGVLIEVVARKRSNSIATLSRATATVARRLPGRVILIALWIFVGFHLFARYTIPR